VPAKFVVTFKPGKEMEAKVSEMEERANAAALRDDVTQAAAAPPDNPSYVPPTSYNSSHG
jgi:integration host factor subunit beta